MNEQELVTNILNLIQSKSDENNSSVKETKHLTLEEVVREKLKDTMLKSNASNQGEPVQLDLFNN